MSNFQSPLFTIAIPTYNRLNYLKEAVESVLGQSIQDFEILIGQDVTPNGLEPTIAFWAIELSKSDSRVRYFSNEHNLGLSGNWNKLVSLAQGEYIIIIGDDDKLASDFLEKAAQQIKSNVADVVFTSQLFINSEGIVQKELTEKLNKEYHRSELTTGLLPDAISVVLKNSVPMSAAIIRKEWLMKHPFDPKLNTPEFEVFLKIALVRGKFVYINEPLAYYRVHLQSATSSGLSIHKLLENVIAIQVPESHENLKYEFVSTKIKVAVNCCLREGNKKLAKQLLYSDYYPKPITFSKLAQRVLLYFPAKLINKLI
jgi:glycosyltransferase involved in cell wall biosynthesis